MDAGVGDRVADGDGTLPVLLRAPPPGHVNRRLGRPVLIVEIGARALAETLRDAARQGLPAGEDQTQRAALRDPRFLQDQPEERRDEVHHRNLPFADLTHDRGGLACAVRRREHEGGAERQRREDLPDGEVEALRGELQDPVARTER